MGIRSFLIQFNDAKEIQKFLEHRHRISQIVYNLTFMDSDSNSDPDRDQIDVLVKFYLKYSAKFESEYESGDWDLDLIGFMYYKGQIWGLIATHSPGEEVMESLMEHVLPNNFWSRLWSVDDKYEKIQPVVVNKENDEKECLEAFEQVKKDKKIVDYDALHKAAWLEEFKTDMAEDKDFEKNNYCPRDHQIEFNEDELIRLIDEDGNIKKTENQSDKKTERNFHPIFELQ